jgi:dTDP-glucose 4,6-dehydratase
LLSDEHLPINIGNPIETSINELAEIINQLIGNKAGERYEPDMRGEGDPQRRRPDISRAEEILEWTPKVSLEEGLLKTIEYFKKELKIYDDSQ